jgi:hypothetical protein
MTEIPNFDPKIGERKEKSSSSCLKTCFAVLAFLWGATQILAAIGSSGLTVSTNAWIGLLTISGVESLIITYLIWKR